MEEMISGLFTYGTKTCRGLVATYRNCNMLVTIDSVNVGTHVDEITIDYTYGTMELAQTENINKVLAEIELNLFIESDVEPEDYPSEVVPQANPQFVDATVALAMISQQSRESQVGGLPNYSDQFVNEAGEREPPINR